MTDKQHNDAALKLVLEQVHVHARKAGEILLSYQNQANLTWSYKEDGSFATQADVASEKYLIEVLRPLVPGAGFYAEETGVQEGNEYQWVIDPLDGTTNFAHGLPYFCVSIALTYRQESVLGVVYHPATQELFSVQRGHGAFANGKRLAVSRQTVFQKAMIAMCTEDVSGILRGLDRWIPGEWPYIRDYGASALDIAYCAAGRFEGVFYEGTKWWDVAAGSLLLEEAGGTFSTLQGGKIGPENSTFVGGAKPIFEQLSPLLRKVLGV